jgi:Fe-S-cluster containining protein
MSAVVVGWDGKPLPCEECGGRCCRYAPIEIKVWDKIKHKINLEEYDYAHKWQGTRKEAMIVWKKDTDGECAFLKDGRCSIYSYRPRACRAVGVIIPCGYAHPEETDKMIQSYREKGVRFTQDDYDTAGKKI